MKLALALILGLCAVAAQASTFEAAYEEGVLSATFAEFKHAPMARDGFMDTIRELVEKAVAQIKEQVEAIVAKAKEVSEVIKEKVSVAIKLAAEKISEIVNDIEGKLKELGEMGAAYKACIQQYKPKLEEIRGQAKEQVKQCSANAFKYAENIQAEIAENLALLKEKMVNLGQEVKKCIEPTHPVSSISCVVGKVGLVTDIVSQIASDSAKIFNEATIVASTAVSCIYTSVASHKEAAQAVVEDIKKCAAQSLF